MKTQTARRNQKPASMPAYKDARLSSAKRVKDLMSRMTLGGAIAGWLLSGYGFVSEAAVQTAHAQSGILLTASVYAGLAFFATAACLFFYPITREVNQEIADELANRRKSFVPQKVT
jgi:Na+/melibiose symporter-like transporter